MQNLTAPSTVTVSQNAVQVVHAGCPFCFVAPTLGTPALTLCGMVVTFKGLKRGDGSEGTDCPMCMDVAETVYADGACRFCP